MRDHDDSPSRERWLGGSDNMEVDGFEETRHSSKHRNRDRIHKEDKDHKSKEGKESARDHMTTRGRRKDEKDELEKEKNRDGVQERDTDRGQYKDRDRKDRVKEKEREREREQERDRDWEKDAERGKDKERRKDKNMDKERERERDRENEREKIKERVNDRDRSRHTGEKEKNKEKTRDKEKETDHNKEQSRDKNIRSHRKREESHERSRDKITGKSRLDSDVNHDFTMKVKESNDLEDESEAHKNQRNAEDEPARSHSSTADFEDRILKMKEERLKKKSEAVSEVLAWVSRSRQLEERSTEKEKALHLSRMFEEQDNMNEDENDDSDEDMAQNTTHDLSGVKILHGLEKVLEGGAVVLTLKDQNILANGGVNEDSDVLENVEIGEQKRRDDAYKAAKKKTTYEDKFNDEPGSEKKILPQYDDLVTDDGITLDATGHIAGEAEKKLEELRRRIHGVSVGRNFEDLNVSGRSSSDYYTQDEMLQFKKPKKKKSLRKKEKLDIDALEAEAKSAGLGVGDFGSRNDDKLRALREQQERNEADNRSSAYQLALSKADEASKILRLGQIPVAHSEDSDAPVIGDDDEELQKSLARARKIALTKQEDAVTPGPQAIAILASSTTNESAVENQSSVAAESQDKRLVFTEMEGFFLGLQHDEVRNPDAKDVFMEEDDVPNTSEQERNDEGSGPSEVKKSMKDEVTETKEEETAPDETIHEPSVGKGLSGALKLFKDRGALKESVEWGGRNMDKKKSKLVGINDDEQQKEIRIERTDEYGRILTPKEAFRLLSHKFHGKGPGKMKQEKRMRQYEEQLKVKQMENSDTPTHSVERMREAQVQQKTPYLVLSGHVKPGQTSDPRSGFATVEKDFPGGLTPMLGDRKVEYFLGKRKPETLAADSQKKSKA